MPANWTIDEVREALASKKVSARELATDYFKRIEARNPELNAYLALSPERALAQADRVDGLVAAGKPLPPLAGVPVAVKNVITPPALPPPSPPNILRNTPPPSNPP